MFITTILATESKRKNEMKITEIACSIPNNERKLYAYTENHIRNYLHLIISVIIWIFFVFVIIILDKRNYVGAYRIFVVTSKKNEQNSIILPAIFFCSFNEITLSHCCTDILLLCILFIHCIMFIHSCSLIAYRRLVFHICLKHKKLLRSHSNLHCTRIL